MKKTLLSIVLVLCILVSMTSCDAIGEGISDMLPEDVKNFISDIFPGLLEEPDVPEDNIDVIVGKINNGVSLNSLAKEYAAEHGPVDPEDIENQLKDQLPEICGDVSVTLTSNGEKQRAYAAIKNNVCYLESNGNKSYVFIEDDLTLVNVSEYDGSYYGSVNDELKNAFGYDENSGNGEVTEPDEQVTELIDRLMNVTLPYITENDVIYRDGKYYLSESYLDKTVHQLSREILEIYYDIYPESTPDDIYKTLEEEVSKTLDTLNPEIWFNAKSEEITGFGYSINARGSSVEELLDGAEINEIRLNVDMNDGQLDVDLYVGGEDEYEELSIEIDIKTTKNDEGKLQTCNGTVKLVAPYTDYDYAEDYSSSTLIRGTQNITIDLSFDAAKVEDGGNVLTAKLNSSVTNVKAYVEDYSSYDYEEHYDEEATRKYQGRKNEMSIEITLDAEQGGEKFDALIKVSQKNNMTGSDYENKASVQIEVTSDATYMGKIPQEAYQAKEDALWEYEMNH